MRSLAQKLGLDRAARAVVLDPPPGWPAAFLEASDPLPLVDPQPLPAADLYLAFAEREVALRGHLVRVVAVLPVHGALWLAWPKRAAGVPTDLVFQTVQAAGLAAGLVDCKVCSLSAVWSGIKLVVPRHRRADWPA